MCASTLTLKTNATTGRSLGPGQLAYPESDVARFLLTRGPYAFLGTAWVGCAPDHGVEGGCHLRLRHCMSCPNPHE